MLDSIVRSVVEEGKAARGEMPAEPTAPKPEMPEPPAAKKPVEAAKAPAEAAPAEKKIEPMHEGGSSVRISVIGCGGAGCNAVSRITQSGIKSATTIAINTDASHLKITDAHRKHVLGYRVTKGLGAGGEPDVARKCAEADADKLKEVVGENEIVFVLAGLGGGTGTGSSPTIARVAKQQGAITIGVVTFPFALERVRIKKAQQGLQALMNECDTVILIDNQRLVDYAPSLPINDAFRIVDKISAHAVRGIADTIVFPSMMNIDYADVKSIMENGGLAMISIGEANGTDFVKSAIKNTLEHPLLDVDYEGAKGALVHIESSGRITLGEAIEISEGVSSGFDENANVKMGARISPDVNTAVRVTAIVTGVKSKSLLSKSGKEEAPEAAGIATSVVAGEEMELL